MKKKGGGERFFWQIECKNKEIFKYHIWQLQEYSWPEKSKGFSEFIHEKLSEGIFAHHGLLCPCRAVFGNCYFWAIIDLPWCGMAYKQTIIMTSLHFGQNRENFVCTLNCNCTSLEPPHGLSSSVNFQRCLRNDEPKAKVFLLKLFTFCLFFFT